ncbi:hypothetical protein OSB04_028541 [Centaurea solstitialis]|uniref:Catalase n=1 Tax=Centaurea solstitialis TaxID=347529 RepID=A0AA38STE0_9ASTR|nr:hypothetical protein OSB04_028541 [Centaurea solstitialis]
MDPYKKTLGLSRDAEPFCAVVQGSDLILPPPNQRPSSAYNAPFWTTNAGAPVYNNTASLTVGDRGPILLEDYHLIEKLANFTRERIPERIVHARGASAKGFFEVTHDITHLTCADFLRAPGVQTPVIVRFSTVIHERGSPETIRDPRGFATKFYTREGNFDIVGNNFPVFFTRDAMAFPDVIHAFKPNPKSHIQEDWRILDFLSHHPESLNTMTFWLDDLGIPTDYRHMEGSSVNALTLINKDGKTHYVKFTWKPTCGVKCLLEDEAVKIGGTNHSHATQDLYDSIAAGNFPEWKLFCQVIDPDHEDRLDFDPLDGTMTWPEDVIPLQPVGRMVLNKNIDNFFAESEQLAFNPGLVVPGIYYSDDKMLQGRIFAYSDTQRHRLGPNYLQLPVNAPKCAHHNNHYDGSMNFMHRDEEVDYFPSRYDRVQHAQQYPINRVRLTATRERTVIPKCNDFKQPGERYRSWAPDRQERFICRMVKMLSDPRVTHELRSIWISYWSQADQSLGQKIASRLNVNMINWSKEMFSIYCPSSARNAPFLTTNAGAPIYNNNSSLTVGPRGPVLLEDYPLVEKLANFDRERIPERVVHARGASAKGFFEVTHDISNLTIADFLRAPGVKTPVIVRFSTVIHERGSPETLRDPRGFAVKFYTNQGNFDMVGNNFPVFFIRDGMQFPDMVHALKPNPKSHIQEVWRILDFFSHHPESLHMFTFLQDDIGVPQDYRHMDGFGVHTFTLINKAGKTNYVKFHWKPTCGVKSLLEDQIIKIGGADHSHATKDLYDSIEAKNFPEWKLFIQIIDPAQEDKFDFDPLDVTKIWPENIVPLMPVGRMVLNKNIDNFFAENEQLAFCPGMVVPGIYYSDDKLLQARIFSYSDSQRYRLGGNYLQIPANAPKTAHQNNHHDGMMNFMPRDEEVDYFPSRYNGSRPADAFPIPSAMLTGKREKCMIAKENNFKQPGDRFRSWPPDRQERFIGRIVGGLSDKRVTNDIRKIWISYWSQVRPTLSFFSVS